MTPTDLTPIMEEIEAAWVEYEAKFIGLWDRVTSRGLAMNAFDAGYHAALTSRPAPAAEVTGERVDHIPNLEAIIFGGWLEEQIKKDGILIDAKIANSVRTGIKLALKWFPDATPYPDAGQVPEGWQYRVVKWHLDNGGSNKRLAGHALRLLHETIELCVAAGASENELRQRVDMEINKEKERGEFTLPVEFEKVREEMADVAILHTILAHHTGSMDISGDCSSKIDVLLTRAWEADEDGVLWRPGRAPIAAAPQPE